MCGRFALVTEKHVLELLFEIEFYEDFYRRYNIAPSEMILTLRRSPRSGEKELVPMKWGLLPPWVEAKGAGRGLINARAETVADRPAFRNAFQRSRALIPASGFYEWRRENKSKQPYFIHLQGGGPFAFGALYEGGRSGGRHEGESCAIITTAANGLIAPIHHRMPLIIPAEAYQRWLDPGTPAGVLRDLLRPYPAGRMEAYAVSSLVNNPAFDHPDCLREDR